MTNATRFSAGGSVVKPKGVNERDLTLGLDTTGGNSKVAMYPWEKLPKANGTGT
jgi:hypothetical protein